MKKYISLTVLFFVLILPWIGCKDEPSESLPTKSTLTSPVIESVDNPPDSEKSLLQVLGYSISVEIVRYATGETVILDRYEPEYAEFMHSFYMSYTGKGFAVIDKSADNINSSTVSVTVPYALGYILTYTLLDSSKIQYNCSSDSIWYDTSDAIYKAPFSEDFLGILEGLFMKTSGDNILSNVSIQPGAGDYLYRYNSSSPGILLRAVSVRTDTLDKDYDLLSGAVYKKGEQCLLVTGQIESQLDQYKYMTMFARGYNNSGRGSCPDS